MKRNIIILPKPSDTWLSNGIKLKQKIKIQNLRAISEKLFLM